jgi:flagellar basal body-associated protein FliL
MKRWHIIPLIVLVVLIVAIGLIATSMHSSANPGPCYTDTSTATPTAQQAKQLRANPHICSGSTPTNIQNGPLKR